MKYRKDTQQVRIQRRLWARIQELFRLGERLAGLQLDQRQSHEVLLAQLGELGARLDRLQSAHESLTADRTTDRETLQRVQLDQRQSHEVLLAQLGELGARLDRIETTSVHTGSHVARTMRRLDAIEERLRARAASPAGTASAVFRPIPVEQLADVLGTPLSDSVLQMRTEHDSSPAYVRDDRPATHVPTAVASAVADFAVERSAVPANSLLVWLLPPCEQGEIADEELIQAIGTIGWAARVRRDVGPDRTTIVLATRRKELLFAAVRWTVTALRSTPDRVRICPHVAPAVVLERVASSEQANSWAEEVATLLADKQYVGTETEGSVRCFGVVWPRAAMDDPQPYLSAAEALRLRLLARRWQLVFQWVDAVPQVTDSTVICALARTLGVRADFTPTVRSQSAQAFAAYDDRAPYRPMEFDLRIPRFSAIDDPKSLICIPRHDVSLVGTCADSFDRAAQEHAEKVVRVLDRSQAMALRLAVTEGRSPAGAWERFIVYNWKTPDPIWARVAVVEPNPEGGDVAILPGVIAPIGELISLIEQLGVVSAPSAPSNRLLQIAAHSYLDQRQAPSADSLRLAKWLPARMGDTLEIGSGYGVLAATFIAATSGYVGVDLTVAQAQSIGRLGGIGLVADMLQLPFRDGSFDTVLADNVIEHALDPVGALSEVRRVLRATGRAYFVIPLDYLGPDYRNEAHLWKADERSIQAALSAAGLTVLRHETCVLPEIGATGSFPSCNQRTSLWEVAVRQTSSPPTGVVEDILNLDWRAMLQADNQAVAMILQRVTEQILFLNERSDLKPLARKSPALLHFDWKSYLELSQIRVVRAIECLQRRGVQGRILDIGAYFGNFALALAELGYRVTALDSYNAYSPAFDMHTAALRAAGVDVVDSADVGADMAGLAPMSFDAVLCMGVIEHVPHTPRLLLAAIDRLLKPGGLLVIDTPNLAYEYKRRRLMQGQTVYAPIETQFETDIPFEGHHREYTSGEVRWMLNRIGYRDIELVTYSYSIFGLPELRGEDLQCWKAMLADPERRELILASARKPLTCATAEAPVE